MRHFIKNDYMFGITILLGLVILFFFPVVIGRQTFFEALPTIFNDRLYEFPYLKTTWTVDGGVLLRVEAPQTLEGVRQLRKGELPLWSPYIGAGQPLAAYPTSGLYHPLRLMIFTFFPFLGTFDFFVILRVLIAGFGMFLYLKEVGLTRLAALLGGVTFMFSGYFMTYLTLWLIAVDMALPYVLWAFERYFKNPGTRNIVLSGLCLSFVILGSQPQASVVFSLVSAAYFCVRLLQKEHAARFKKGLIHLAAIGMLAVLIALPLIVDFSVSIRNFAYEHTRGTWRLSWPEMLHLIVSPSMFLEAAMAGRIYQDTLTPVPYLGLSVLMLALAGFFSSHFRFQRYFFGGLIAFFVLKIAGFFAVNWIGTLPVLNQIFWGRLFMPIALGVSLLAAIGYEAVGERRIAVRKILFGAGALFAPYLALFLFRRDVFMRWYVPVFDFGRRPDLAPAIERFLGRLPAGIKQLASLFLENGEYFTLFLFSISALFAFFTLLFMYHYFKKGKVVFLGLVFVLVLIELFIYVPKIRDGSFHRFNPYPVSPAVNFIRHETSVNAMRFIGAREVISPHTASLFGIYDFRSITHPLRRYKIFSERFLEKESSGIYSFREHKFNEITRRFLSLASVGYIAAEEQLANSEALELLYDGELKIYGNSEALPRAYIVHNFEWVEDADRAAARLGDPGFNYRESVVLDGPEKPMMSSGMYGLSNNNDKVVLERYEPNTVVLRVLAEQRGLLVLTDAYYPGWKAFVDGKETKIYPANVLFRAVEVPAGEHEIVFRYEPWWVPTSLALSLTALIFSFIVVVPWKSLLSAWSRRL